MLLRGENKRHGEAIKMPHLTHDKVMLQQWKPRVSLEHLPKVNSEYLNYSRE
jgi:hypothetical protein